MTVTYDQFFELVKEHFRPEQVEISLDAGTFRQQFELDSLPYQGLELMAGKGLVVGDSENAGSYDKGSFYGVDFQTVDDLRPFSNAHLFRGETRPMSWGPRPFIFYPGKENLVDGIELPIIAKVTKANADVIQFRYAEGNFIELLHRGELDTKKLQLAISF